MPAAALRSIAAAVALFFAFSGLCAEESEAPVPRPEVKPGDRWTYRAMDYWTNVPQFTYELRVTYVGPDLIHTVVTRRGKEGEADRSFTSEWNNMEGGDGRVFDPPRRLLKFPLKVGTAYETSWEMVAMPGSSARFSNEAVVKVTGWEDVVVPAGKFRALKIEAKGSWRRLDQIGAGWQRFVIWYAPEVKRWVKWAFEGGVSGPDTKNGDELIEFNVQ
jgi:hypothetical protein